MLSNRALKSIISLGIVAIILLLIGIIYVWFQASKYTVYETDTIINGDWVVSAGNPIKVRNNAKLTITGNAILEDEVVCDEGGIHLEVQGTLIGKDAIHCDSDPNSVGTDNAGIHLVLKGHAIFSSQASLSSKGSIQLVDDKSKLAASQEAIDNAFENFDQRDGVGIGPLGDNGAELAIASPSIASTVRDALIPAVHAQTQGVDLNDPEQNALFERLLDEMRNYIEATNPSNDEILQLVQELSELLGATEEDLDAFGALLRLELYQALVSAPNPEELTRWFFERALAQGETVVIMEGEIMLGDGGRPPFDLDLNDRFKREDKVQDKPKKVILNYDFSDDTGFALQNITIRGLDGVHFGGITAPSCDHTGNNGGDAMRFTGRAGSMRIGNFTLENGNGGTGETVVSPDNCEASSMTGGNGGRPGNIKLIASRSFIIDGTFTIVPGQGGQGGGARAVSENNPSEACPGNSISATKAVGGTGGDSKQRLRTSGSVIGLTNVEIEPAIAGAGGHAIANASDTFAGDGDACNCAGGNGAIATAIGGKGGDAAPSRSGESKGGDGGNAEALGGLAGDGGSCGENEPTGGSGGNGGDAIATPGKGGGGDINGNDGSILTEQGGDAGFGGDGCVEGKKGLPGKGSTPGEEAEDGENTCTTPPKEKEYFISVVNYNGLLIPVFQLRVAGPDACDTDHWHGGPAKALNGEIVNDPAPDACGFGKTGDLIPFDEPVNGEEIMGTFGDSITQYLSPNRAVSESTQENTDDGCMIQLCQVGGSWVPCPNQPNDC